MGGQGLPRGYNTEQSSLGIAFDAFVKYNLAIRLGKEKEAKNKLATLLDGIDPNWKQVIPIANDLCEKYIEQGCLNRLIADGIEDIELTSFADIGGKKIAGSEKFIGQVRLFGKPDASLTNKHAPTDKRIPIPLDWKVNGYKSNSTVSPKKGYIRRIIDGYDRGNHIQAGIEFQDIDRDWAQQLLFYNWMLGNDTGPFHGAIEQILINNSTDGVIRRVEFISYRGVIGFMWACNKQAEVQAAWDRIQEGDFDPAMPSDFKCVPFNNPRPCTLVCPEYERMVNNVVENSNDIDRMIRGR